MLQQQQQVLIFNRFSLFLLVFLQIVRCRWCIHALQPPASPPNTNTRREYLEKSSQNVLGVMGSFWLGSNAQSQLVAAEEIDATTGQQSSFVPSGKKTPYLMDEAYLPGVTKPEAGRFFFPTLTPPFRNRATYLYELGRNTWALEQLLTFANVTATIRTNVVKLQQDNDDSLWVNSPQWPTGEFCSLLDSLGTVKHIVLPCNAFEHKSPMKAFVSKYPDATVWISPGQYGPFGVCGLAEEQKDMKAVSKSMGYRVDGILPLKPNTPGKNDATSLPPWIDEFDFATILIDLPENAGPVSEVAFCHRPSNTLVATDAVVFIPKIIPPSNIFRTYFDAATVDDSTFWPRTVLQSVFLPLRTDSSGAYPGFEAIADRLVRAPILRGFNDARGPDETRKWVETVSNWKFDRIITSHFASPIAANPNDFADAFQYLVSNPQSIAKGSGDSSGEPPIPCQDWALLDTLNDVIAEYKLGAPAKFDYKQGCVP